MKIAYTVTSGYVKCNEDTSEIHFAIIFIDNGVYKVETFFKDKGFFERNEKNSYFLLTGKTEKGWDIECHGLFRRFYKYENQKAEFICDNYIKLSNNKKTFADEPEKEKTDEDTIFFVEMEGLRLHFSDFTQITRHRVYGEVDRLNNSTFDHTSCPTIINHSEFKGGNYYHLIFLKNPENENIIIDFTKNDGYCKFYFENYQKIKIDLVNFLSFINGGPVFIRRELAGRYYNEGGQRGYDAQTVYLYSKRRIVDFHCSNYLPINEHHSYSRQIFLDLFNKNDCFDKYIKLNKELDFNSLVFSLNNSYQTAGLEERYFILIGALEKISSNYSKAKNNGKQTLIDKTFFDKIIKQKLNEAIESFKSKIEKDNRYSWEIFKSRIGSLNNRNEADTVAKLYDFLQYAKIPMSDAVKNLIEIERHRAIHEGIIGETERESVDNYWKLDHILRDVILNLIGYESIVKPKFNYATEEEFKNSYPKEKHQPKQINITN